MYLNVVLHTYLVCTLEIFKLTVQFSCVHRKHCNNWIFKKKQFIKTLHVHTQVSGQNKSCTVVSINEGIFYRDINHDTMLLYCNLMLQLFY